MKVIGITGLGRSGKNSFANLLQKTLEEKGLSVKQYALATFLKEDCKQFLLDKCQIDVWTDETPIKELFRPLLVWYGDFKRRTTSGKYWTQLVQKEIKKNQNYYDYFLITDIRYFNAYPEDEFFWLKNQMNGLLIHIKRYELDKNNNKVFLTPPNDHEATNDPKLEIAADYRVSWPTVGKEEFNKLQIYIDNFIYNL